MGSRKGKEVASGEGTGDDEFKTGRYKRKRSDIDRAVLQFFEDSAAEVDGEDDFDDFMEEDFDSGPNQNAKNNESKVDNLPILPKEEQFEEELDKMMEEQCKSGASFVRYAKDEFETKKLIEKDSHLQTTKKEPIIWKVKCMVGRERYSAFCLMQKFVDLQSLGQKLTIVSAFAVDHVKGHIFIEADKQPEVDESCKGLCSIYTSRVVPVPRNEVSQLFSVRSRHSEVSEGMWCRIKSGNYKGDLAQIVAVNNEKRRATLKLIPRIDIQVLVEKYGGGSVKRGRSSAAIPAPRLISSSELEEFRPLMQSRRDRDTGKYFEILDGMMLKDGYLYKRAALDSLTLWGVVPSEEELLKFQPSDNSESGDLEWLSKLYGEQMIKRLMQYEKGGEKGEGSSKKEYNLYELVATGAKSFGLIVGVQKEDSFLILREGLEGQEVFSAGVYEITSGPIHAKFTAPDRQNKSISVNDTVRVLEGPLKDRQGIVKQIYRGVVFSLDENEVEHGGYFCFKAHLCEKVKPAEEILVGKDGESSFCGVDDLPSSPKSPLSPKKPWQARENRNDFNRGNRDGPFSIGQTLRIRVGPLEGYLCRVIARSRSEVAVKLNSQQRVLAGETNTATGNYDWKPTGQSTGRDDGGGLSWSKQAGSPGKDGVGAGSSWGKSDGGGGSSYGNSAIASCGQQVEESNKWNCGNTVVVMLPGTRRMILAITVGIKGKSVVKDPSTNLNKQMFEGATDPSTGGVTPLKEQDSGNNQSSWKKSEISWRTVTQGGSTQDQTDSWSQNNSSVSNGGSWNKNRGGGGGSWNNKKDEESAWAGKSGGSSCGGQGESNSDVGGWGKKDCAGGWGGGSGSFGSNDLGKGRVLAAGEEALAAPALVVGEKVRTLAAGEEALAAPTRVVGEKLRVLATWEEAPAVEEVVKGGDCGGWSGGRRGRGGRNFGGLGGSRSWGRSESF